MWNSKKYTGFYKDFNNTDKYLWEYSGEDILPGIRSEGSRLGLRFVKIAILKEGFSTFGLKYHVLFFFGNNKKKKTRCTLHKKQLHLIKIVVLLYVRVSPES